MKLGIIGGWGLFVRVLEETERMSEVEVVGLTKGVADWLFSLLQGAEKYGD